MARSERMREVQLAPDVRLYLADCREVLPQIQRPAAIITDMPYGQRLNTNVWGKGVTGRSVGDRRGRPVGGLHSTGRATLWPAEVIGDGQPVDPTWLLTKAAIVLLWGHHRFGHKLPAGTILVWDKVPTGKIRDQGDGETAWLNMSPVRPLRIFRLLWDGVCVGSGARHEVTAGQSRHHPTQKPEALMAWCIEQARVPAGGTICDPYMGSGSTGVAAVRAGHGFVGIELEPLYFETACRRIEDALRRPNMFAPPLAIATQEPLL